MQASAVNSGTETAIDTWRAFIVAHAGLVRALDRELRAAHQLPLHEYEVLLVLARSEDGRLRMTDLADAVLLSQSGLTRLVDRLVRRGLVSRARCDSDKRGFYAVITHDGRALFERARRTHLSGVDERFLSRFDDGELATLLEAFERIDRS
jgi:DNA-binding MarR family transcriptional regulator